MLKYLISRTKSNRRDISNLSEKKSVTLIQIITVCEDRTGEENYFVVFRGLFEVALIDRNEAQLGLGNSNLLRIILSFVQSQHLERAEKPTGGGSMGHGANKLTGAENMQTNPMHQTRLPGPLTANGFRAKCPEPVSINYSLMGRW